MPLLTVGPAEADGPTLATTSVGSAAGGGSWLLRRRFVGVAAPVFTAIQPAARYTVQHDRAGPPDRARRQHRREGQPGHRGAGRPLARGRRARPQELMGRRTRPDELVQGVTVTVPPNSQVLHVAFEAGTPQLAQSGSHAFAQAYLDLQADVAKRGPGDRDRRAPPADRRGQEAARRRHRPDRRAAAPTRSTAQRAEADRSVLTNQLTDAQLAAEPAAGRAARPG